MILSACAPRGGEIATFEECVNAGYPVMESYPRRCRVPDGPLFTEELPPITQFLDTFTGSLLEADVDDKGDIHLKIFTLSGEREAVLEPDASVSSESMTETGSILLASASGAFLDIQGWADESGVIHAVTVVVRD